jgi:BMFP domain-containing protein YqiC
MNEDPDVAVEREDLRSLLRVYDIWVSEEDLDAIAPLLANTRARARAVAAALAAVEAER